MKLPDTNLLVYAFNASAPHHRQAVAWWEEQLNGTGPVVVCWPVLQGFVRLLTGRHIVEEPYLASELLALIDQWWKRPNVRLLAPSQQTYSLFRGLMETHQLAGSASTDALIAAHALEHGATLVSNDTDFARFSGLRVFNPFT